MSCSDWTCLLLIASTTPNLDSRSRMQSEMTSNKQNSTSWISLNFHGNLIVSFESQDQQTYLFQHQVLVDSGKHFLSVDALISESQADVTFHSPLTNSPWAIQKLYLWQGPWASQREQSSGRYCLSHRNSHQVVPRSSSESPLADQKLLMEEILHTSLGFNR